MSEMKCKSGLEVPTPASLEPGKYLSRQEYQVLEVGPVQWYANCIQLDVSGSETSLPSKEELVPFHGAHVKVSSPAAGW